MYVLFREVRSNNGLEKSNTDFLPLEFWNCQVGSLKICILENMGARSQFWCQNGRKTILYNPPFNRTVHRVLYKRGCCFGSIFGGIFLGLLVLQIIKLSIWKLGNMKGKKVFLFSLVSNLTATKHLIFSGLTFGETENPSLPRRRRYI